MNFERAISKLKKCVDDLYSKYNRLEELYDEKSCNEPETDSQKKKWEESLEELENRKDILYENTERLDEFASLIEDLTEDTYDAEDYSEFEDIISEYEGYNKQFRGIMGIINDLKSVLYFLQGEDNDDDDEDDGEDN